MTRRLSIGESWAHKIPGGTFSVTQFDGYWSSRTDTGGPMREHREDGWYEVPDEPQKPMNGADEYVTDPEDPGQLVPAWRLWAYQNHQWPYNR